MEAATAALVWAIAIGLWVGVLIGIVSLAMILFYGWRK